jgi:hypothetical protein
MNSLLPLLLHPEAAPTIKTANKRINSFRMAKSLN